MADQQKIVSLLPGATEICHALGLTDQLVGVSHDCDWPPEIRDLPVLSQSVVDEEASSREIDETVKEQVHDGKSIYHIDDEQLRSLDPDVIFTQELCEVCAPSFDHVQEAARTIRGETDVVSLEPQTIEGILENIRLVGSITGREDRAKLLIEELEDRIQHVNENAGDSEQPVRTLCLEWLDPLYIAGHWVPEMVEMAGGTTMNEPGHHSVDVSWEDALEFRPERVVLMPCGFSPQRTERELDRLTANTEWGQFDAVEQDQVFVVHGSYYFNRPGPRIGTGLETLAQIINPERFSGLELPDNALFKLRDNRLVDL